MSKSLKKNIIVYLLLVLLSAFVCLCAVESPINTLATDTQTAKFEVVGASVRIQENFVGIRFVAEINSKYVSDLSGTLTYKGSINAVGADENQARETNLNAPNLTEENTTDFINVSVIYNNLDESLKQAACKVNLVPTFTISGVEGGDKVATGAFATSMRAAANYYYLIYTDENQMGFEKSALETYFEIGNHNQTVTGYSYNTGKTVFTMPNLADFENGATVDVYLGYKLYSATYNAETKQFTANGITVENGETAFVTIFDEEGKAYSTKIIGANEVNSSNVDNLLTATSGYYALSENINMSTAHSGSWDNYSNGVTFKGTLDGAGYTIDNLTLATNSALFRRFGGTVKDIAFTNVTLGGDGAAAVIAKNQSGMVTIDNVFIQVKSVKGAYAEGGIISQNTDSKKGDQVFNNVFVMMPNTSSESLGLATGSNSQITQNFTNAIFVGGNGKLNGSENSVGKTGELNKDYFIFDDVTDVYLARKNGTLVMNDFINAHFNKVHNVTEVATLSDITALTGTENVVLTAEISQSSYFNSGSSSFSGIFNGNGHSISIMPTRAGGGRALFTTFNGTMKNVAFTNINLGAQTALVGYNTSGATVKDVYVEVAGVVLGYAGKLYQTGGLFGKVSGGRLNLKNVIVNSTTNAWDGDAGKNVAFTGANDESNEYGFVGGWINGTTVNMENCQFIGGNGRIYGYKADNSAEYKPSNELTGYNIYTNVGGLKTAVSNQTVNLTGMIKTFYDSYIAQ